MSNRNAIVQLSFLIVFEAGLALGLSVLYSILSPNCGYTGRVESLRRSIPLRPYGMKVENKTSFIFDVKATRDVGIYVTSIPNSPAAPYAYRFVIGSYNNGMLQLQEIRNGTDSQKNSLSGSYLNYGLLKPFWCSWENGEIRLGQGGIVGQNILMSWTNPNPFSVDGVGIGTCYGSSGEWKIKVEVEDNFVGHFSNCQRSNMTSGLPVIANFVTSKLSCAENCATETTCFGFNYQQTNQRCELLSYGDEPVTSIMQNDLEGWSFYAKCYDGKAVCVGCFF